MKLKQHQYLLHRFLVSNRRQNVLEDTGKCDSSYKHRQAIVLAVQMKLGSEALSSLQPPPLTGGDLSLFCLLTALGLILTGIS